MHCKRNIAVDLFENSRLYRWQRKLTAKTEEVEEKKRFVEHLAAADLKVEIAAKGDIESIIDLEKTVFSSPDIFKPAQLARVVKQVNSKVFVMRDENGKIVAEIVGLLRRFKGKPSGRIYKIAIARFLMGKHVAEVLLNAMEKFFIENGMKAVCAEVRKSNIISQHFFAKHGYIMTNILPAYYSDGEDGCKFWKRL